MINSALWSIILMIASIVLAAKVPDIKDDLFLGDQWCDSVKCHSLNASYVSKMYLYCHFVLKTKSSKKISKS